MLSRIYSEPGNAIHIMRLPCIYHVTGLQNNWKTIQAIINAIKIGRVLEAVTLDLRPLFEMYLQRPYTK
jgi:hypothetical protein